MLEPKIDVLVVGTGNQSSSPEISRRIIKFIKAFGINVEVLRTEQVKRFSNIYILLYLFIYFFKACATFNFLNTENRMVAAALIPPVHISYNENDLLQKKLRNKELNQIF